MVTVIRGVYTVLGNLTHRVGTDTERTECGGSKGSAPAATCLRAGLRFCGACVTILCYCSVLLFCVTVLCYACVTVLYNACVTVLCYCSVLLFCFTVLWCVCYLARLVYVWSRGGECVLLGLALWCTVRVCVCVCVCVWVLVQV